MRRLHIIQCGISMVFILTLFSQCHTIQQPDEYYCNLMAGEPTQTSVIMFARLQKTDTLVNNDLPGIDGYIKFWITRDSEAKYFMYSPFFHATDSNDFIAKFEFTGLRPGQKYYYRISYGRDTSNNTTSPWNSFETLNLPSSDKSISFVVANGFDFKSFRTGNPSENIPAATISSLKSGFPAFHALSSCKPDFWIGNGDFDSNYNLEDSLIINQKDFRTQWHWLFSMSEFNKLLSHIPSFWLLPGNDIKVSISAGQVPFFANSKDAQSSCRTYRLNRDVQIWMVESNVARPIASDLNIYNWLKSTLKESDAPFKLLITSVPLIGPVDAPKINNLTNIEEFRTGKDSLFNWLKNNGFLNNGLYFICCKPLWQYHAIDPSGFEEFSCGSLIDASYHLEEIPEDSLSADPAGKIVRRYVQKEASGGFLMIDSGRDEFNSPVLLFRYFDDQKKLLYAVNKF